MIFTLYLFMLAATLVITMIGLTNIFRVTREQQILLMSIALVMAIVTLFGSFTIDNNYCELVNVTLNYWLCHTETYQDLPMVGFNFLLIAIIVLYLMVDFFGWRKQ